MFVTGSRAIGGDYVITDAFYYFCIEYGLSEFLLLRYFLVA